MARALEAAAGTIYDIGYRNYEGERLGRGYAFRTLYVHSLRSAFGLGRGGKALIGPWLLFLAMCFPAVVTVAVAGISGGLINNIIDYHEIFPFDATLLALFCAAQGPELVSTDQYNRVLPLYFSRALRQGDYAAAKLLAMWTAVFILMVTPLVIILIGRVALPVDFAEALRTESRNVLPILGSAVAAALVMGTLAVALASYVPRRGIGSAVVLGVFLLTAVLAAILMETLDGAGASKYIVLINPILTVTGAVLGLFDERPERGTNLRDAGLAPEVYYAAAAAYGIVFLLLLLNRYRRIRA
jgi:ABC-2 type transport system permease protein